MTSQWWDGRRRIRYGSSRDGEKEADEFGCIQFDSLLLRFEPLMFWTYLMAYSARLVSLCPMPMDIDPALHVTCPGVAKNAYLEQQRQRRTHRLPSSSSDTPSLHCLPFNGSIAVHVVYHHDVSYFSMPKPLSHRNCPSLGYCSSAHWHAHVLPAITLLRAQHLTTSCDNTTLPDPDPPSSLKTASKLRKQWKQ
jgi:hypothetical protein